MSAFTVQHALALCGNHADLLVSPLACRCISTNRCRCPAAPPAAPAPASTTTGDLQRTSMPSAKTGTRRMPRQEVCPKTSAGSRTCQSTCKGHWQRSSSHRLQAELCAVWAALGVPPRRLDELPWVKAVHWHHLQQAGLRSYSRFRDGWTLSCGCICQRSSPLGKGQLQITPARPPSHQRTSSTCPALARFAASETIALSCSRRSFRNQSTARPPLLPLAVPFAAITAPLLLKRERLRRDPGLTCGYRRPIRHVELCVATG